MDTALTEIYTDSHTLPQHDALPSWPSGRPDDHCSVPISRRPGPRASSTRAAASAAVSWSPCPSKRALRTWLAMVTRSMARVTSTTRSEEHTSELQSLMRISYAVFCLKKQNE